MRHNKKKRSAKATQTSKKTRKFVEKQKKPEVTTASYSVIGDRLTQEDAVYLSTEGTISLTQKARVLAVICDGMGGMANGGQASATAIQMIKDTFEQVQEDSEVNIPNFFISGIKTIDNTIYNFPRVNGKGSGTTMVAVLVENNQLYWASVGDSRIYILREKTLTQVTRDHNYMLRLQEMVNQGQISQEEANTNRQREALISFLGIGNVSLLDVNMDPFQLQSGDIILLTSDGMTKVLSEEQIMDILSDNSSVEDRAKKLVETAVEQNMRSQDNTTVAVLQYQETI